MTTFRLESAIRLHRPLAQVYPFFADAFASLLGADETEPAIVISRV
jgi:hypothetical protein